MIRRTISIALTIFLILPACTLCAQEAAELGHTATEQAIEAETATQETMETATPDADTTALSSHTIFNDQMLLDGYSEKYADFSQQILLEMIQDDTLSSYKSAAAVRVFREKYGEDVVSREKKIVIKMLLRRLNRTTSPFVQVEIMYTLNYLDRYRYFKSMVPALILKLNHYNETVNVLAFEYLENITLTSTYRAREANIVFNTLRKVLFLSRKRLANVTKPDEKLARKLKILRWSIKVLGNEKLKKLPKEVLGLL